jgi:hypothetical protein
MTENTEMDEKPYLDSQSLEKILQHLSQREPRKYFRTRESNTITGQGGGIGSSDVRMADQWE